MIAVDWKGEGKENGSEKVEVKLKDLSVFEGRGFHKK
jgi:hypothetical protein